MAINFKDWQKNLQEELIDEIDESAGLDALRARVNSNTQKVKDRYNASTQAIKDRNNASTQRLKDKVAANNQAIKDRYNANLAKEEIELDETPVTKPKAPYRPGSIDPATGKTREAPKGTYAYDKAQREKNKVKEELTGNQHKLDVDKDGKIERSDLKKLRAKKDEIVVNKGEQVRENDNCGKKMYREFVEEMQELAEIAEAKKDDYWDFKDLKAKEKNQPTSRKVAGTRYGGSAQKDEPEDDDNDDKPAVKRGRGRPAGSKSGARQKGNGNNYGGLAIHSLNLPSKK